ncbi:hypothetical protein MBLNU459_g1360t1 [Dothideomycetes sp. NU459]
MSVQAHHAASLAALPAEILLEAITLVPYTPTSIKSLKLVCRRFNGVVCDYEHSVARSIVQAHFPHRLMDKFPSLSQRSGINYAMVEKLHDRLNVLRFIEKNCNDIKERDGKHSSWMETRWIRLQSVGLLLSYRLCDCGGHEEQAELLRQLPYTSLAALFCTLMISIQQLRADGPDILHHHSPVQVRAFRTEIELACQELLLERGPDYLHRLLEQDQTAIK